MSLPFLWAAWAAFSPGAAILATVGLVLVVVVGLSAALVPERLKLPLVVAGGLLIFGAAVWQAGEAKGAHDALAKGHALELAAEKLRAGLSDKIARDIAAEATADLGAAQTDNANLKALLHDAEKRADAGRVCVPRDLSRRLRAL